MRWLVAVLLSLALQASAQTVWKPKPATPAMARELFGWFDKLGYTNTLKGRIFRLERSAWNANGTKKQVESWYAFERGRGQYVDFSLIGATEFDRAVPAKPAEALAAELGKRDPYPNFHRDGMLAEDKSTALVEAIAWARVAALHGREDLALRFLDKALLLNWGDPLVGFMKAEMARREFDASVYVLLKPGTSWPLFRKGISRVAARFPDQPAATLANQLIQEVDETIKLDRRRATDPIGRLIDALVMEPSWNYTGWEGSSAGAAAKLAGKGFKAVPQLISALDDRRLTHTLYGRRDWRLGPGHQVRQVRTRVLEILEAISGQRFQPEYYELPKDVEPLMAAAKPKVLAWWMAVKDRREVDVLTERVLKGDYYGAKDLARRYPDAFPYVLRTYLIKGGDIATHLRNLLGSVHTPEAAKLAEELLQKETDPDQRRSWAQTFADTAPSAAARVLLETWNAYPKGHQDPSGIAATMVTLGQANAVDAVARELYSLPLQDRYGVINRLTRGLANGSDEAPLRLDRSSPAFASYKKSIEKLLVSELSDTVWGFDDYMYKPRKDEPGPRICDLAALALAKCFPEKYRYKASQFLDARNALCRRMGAGLQAGSRGPLIVRSVQVREADLPEEAVSMVRSWVGKRLTATRVVQLFEALKKSDSGFCFTAVRDRSGLGFQVNLEAGRRDTGQPVTGWYMQEIGYIGPGEEPIYYDLSGYKSAFERERWISFMQKVEKAPARVSVQMVFSARR